MATHHTVTRYKFIADLFVVTKSSKNLHQKKVPLSKSEIMRAVKSRNTAPKIAVRRLLCEAGLNGYRLHRKDLTLSPKN